jgi:cytochrome c oxidase accessory protein FixG
MTTRRFQRWRRVAGAAQALAFLGLPFVTIRGESALRLDVPGGRLHAVGATFALGEAFPVLAATLFLVAAFLLLTVLLGRVWCGWSCPQTVLGDLTSWLVPLPRKRQPRWRRPAGLAAAVAISALFAAASLWYFVPPREFLARLAAGTLGPVLGGSWAVLGAILLADLVLVRQTFCATVCPYAKLQGVLFDASTLVVAYDGRRDADCVDCGACVRVCPTGIDIRDGLQMECIACAACIDACQPIMAKLRRAPDLIGYFHGEPGRKARPVRPAPVALGAVTLATLAALVGSVTHRDAVHVSAQRSAVFAPRRGADGLVVNAFALALENRGERAVTVALAARPEAGGEVALRPAAVDLAPGEARQVRLLATARGLPSGAARVTLTAEVREDGHVVERRSTELSLVVPEER